MICNVLRELLFYELVLLDPSVIETFPLRLILLTHPLHMEVEDSMNDSLGVADCQMNLSCCLRCTEVNEFVIVDLLMIQIFEETHGCKDGSELLFIQLKGICI